jgi:hypothetical protein
MSKGRLELRSCMLFAKSNGHFHENEDVQSVQIGTVVREDAQKATER